MKNKCLACHNELEEPYLFCSLTCMILCGYMSVRSDQPHKDASTITQKEIDEFLNNPPVRPNYPDKSKYDWMSTEDCA